MKTTGDPWELSKKRIILPILKLSTRKRLLILQGKYVWIKEFQENLMDSMIKKKKKKRAH
jgi:hypothetical protein